MTVAIRYLSRLQKMLIVASASVTLSQAQALNDIHDCASAYLLEDVEASNIQTTKLKIGNSASCASRIRSESIAKYKKRSHNEQDLVVMLHGTGGRPENFSWLLSMVAERDSKVIGLSYVNDRSLNQVCGGSEDQDKCLWETRQAVLHGGKTVTGFSIKPYESIHGNLKTIIATMAEKHSGDGWEKFLLRDGELAWNRMTFVGFSQGAGHAAMIAKQWVLKKVILISGPNDWNLVEKRTPAWYSLPSATASERYFAIYHEPDDIANPEGINGRILRSLQILLNQDSEPLILDGTRDTKYVKFGRIYKTDKCKSSKSEWHSCFLQYEFKPIWESLIAD